MPAFELAVGAGGEGRHGGRKRGREKERKQR